jgi:dephospho-CoA kinase
VKARRYTRPVLMVGLTGGIGAGKSMVARRLAELGAFVVDADKLAREVVEKGTPGLAEVVDAFGSDTLAPDGSLDRAALAARVFGDDAARGRLESIIHPRVRERSAELIAAAPPDAVVVNDVPLLVEKGLHHAYELVIVVLADEDVRVDRLTRDRAMTPAEAHARIATQATDEQRRAVADVVIVNNGTPAELIAQVDQVWSDKLAG